MKTASVASLLASILFAQQAAATYDWGNCSPYPKPDNCPNQCTPDQQGGYSWHDLPSGNFGSYKGMNFKGFTCQDSFKSQSGKRGLSIRTQFQSKCIQGKATQDDNCPSFSHDQGFSIKHMQISTDKDSDLEFHYGMPDGSTCKQVTHCKSSGSTVENNQCGGAKSVQVKGDCNFGIHSIEFDCTSHTTPTPPKTTTPSCGYGSTLSSGQCVPPQTTPPSCGYGSTLSSGKCVPPQTTTPSCGHGSTLSSGKCVPPQTTITTTTTTPQITTTSSTVKDSTTPCGKDSTISSGTCVGTVKTTTTPPTTPPVSTTSDCGKGSTMSSGTCVCTTTTPPTTSPVSTTSDCGKGSTMSQGTCVPKTTPATTAPPTTTPVATTGCGKGSTMSKGTCICTTTTSSTVKDTTSITTTTPPPPTTTIATTQPGCDSGSTLENGKCMPQTTTPPATTITTKPGCDKGSTMDNGKCVPSTTPTPPTTTTTTKSGCDKGSTIDKNGKCVPQTSETTAKTPPSTVWSDWEAWTTVSQASKPVKSEAPCPEVLPKCLSTWLHTVEDCKSNSDSKCFCPSKDYIANVQQCVEAWGQDNDEVSAALSYLIGICADYVPQNPQICTGVPTTVTLVATPKPASPISETQQSIPVTTITYTQTLTTDSSTVVTQSVVSVPQVVFNTVQPAGPSNQNVSPTQSVALYPGSSAPAAPSNTASTPSQTGPQATFTGAASPRSVSYGVFAGAFGLLALAL